jgi:hypothetical protein
MTMPISPQRKQDIIWELRAAAHYFERLAAEIESDPQSHPDAPEQQTAKLIFQGILLLQWRLESQSDEASNALFQKAMLSKRQDQLVRGE